MNVTSFNSTLGFQTYYCNQQTDFYAILTAYYYFIFGFLGLTVNNSYMNETHTYLVLTGVGLITNFAGVQTAFGINALIICSCNILYKLLAELLKKWYDERWDSSETSKNVYRLPTAFLSLMMGSYICASLVWYNIFFTLPILICICIFTIIGVIKFFPQGTQLYTVVRKMTMRLCAFTVLGSIGLCTSLYCPTDVHAWIRIFIGWPMANLTLAYALFLETQIILLIRGKNLKRKVSVRSSDVIFITYYVGRMTTPISSSSELHDIHDIHSCESSV